MKRQERWGCGLVDTMDEIGSDERFSAVGREGDGRLGGQMSERDSDQVGAGSLGAVGGQGEVLEQASKEYLQFGGMAVPEGVMMRSPNFYAVACRAPNGEVIVRTEPLDKTWLGRLGFLKKPFLRGSLALLDTMGLGMRAMNFASEVQLDARYVREEEREQAKREALEQAEPTGKEYRGLAIVTLVLVVLAAVLWPALQPFLAGGAWDTNTMLWPGLAAVMAGLSVVTTIFWGPIKRRLSTDEKLAIAVAVVVSLGFGFLIFKAAPEALSQVLFGQVDRAGTGTNYFAEVVKALLFIGYLVAIRRIPAILDTFKYHGAEHKAINAIEAKEELTAESCMAQTRLHPRCGTNFAIVVIMISFLIVPLIPRYPVIFGYELQGAAAVVFRLVLDLFVFTPIVAGISYEVIRAAGNMKDQRWVEVLLKPGLATQLITTEEPDERHVEVAIRSLNAVLRAEKTGELENTEAPPLVEQARVRA